jgi:uncharacterized integral membrane protein
MADRADDPSAGGDWAEFKDGKPKDGGGRDITPRIVVAGLALVAAIIFVVQNDNRVEANFLFFDADPRLWVVIVVSLLLGALLGQGVGVLRRRRKRGHDD